MPPSFKKFSQRWRGVFWVVLIVTAAIIALRLLGWLQPFEWAVLDIYFQNRPLEARDERIIIVGLEETDIQKYRWPVNDQVLAKLLTKIKTQNPRVIGLDIFRDVPVPPGEEELVKVLKTTPNIIGVQNVLGDKSTKIAPPPILAERGQVSTSDVVLDRDGVFRRYLLYPVASDNPNLPSFGVRLALDYLRKEGIEAKTSSDRGWLQLGDVIFSPLQKNEGGYVNTDAEGYQILLNYRGPAQSFQRVSFAEVLEDKIAPNLFRDKIVLIGSTALSIKDTFDTPYTRWLNKIPLPTYGIEIQANLVSQIISAVLEQRPLLKVLPDYLEYLWILFWVFLPAFLGWKLRWVQDNLKFSWLTLSISLLLAFVLIRGTYLAFLKNWWIPIVPSLLGLGMSTIVMIGYVYIWKLKQAKENLEKQVDLRTKELKQTLIQLESTQNQAIAKERLALLGTLVLGVAHELKNPLNFVVNFTTITLSLVEELKDFLDQKQIYRSEDIEIKSLFDDIIDNLKEIEKHSRRSDNLIQNMLLQTNLQNTEKVLADINDLLAASLKLVYYSHTINRPDFDLYLETTYDQSISQIKIIATDISEIFINLIDNACYSLQEKSQRLGRTFQPSLSVQTKKSNNTIEIIIEDNGEGIASEITETLFQPFTTTKPPGQGTGLGLYITYDLVQKNQGAIRWETEIGSYTRFMVTLPISQE